MSAVKAAVNLWPSSPICKPTVPHMLIHSHFLPSLLLCSVRHPNRSPHCHPLKKKNSQQFLVSCWLSVIIHHALTLRFPPHLLAWWGTVSVCKAHPCSQAGVCVWLRSFCATGCGLCISVTVELCACSGSSACALCACDSNACCVLAGTKRCRDHEDGGYARVRSCTVSTRSHTFVFLSFIV